MIREEAKEIFLNRGFIDGVYDGGKWREACIVISKWLEQEPTTKNDLGVDAVSRKAVLNQIFYSTDNSGDVVLGSALRERIERLSSVTPQEPRWIPVSERLPKIADVYRVTRYYPNNVMNPKYLVDACAFDGSNTWYNDNRINHERAYADNIIAWQENPEPYEPQESEK